MTSKLFTINYICPECAEKLKSSGQKDDIIWTKAKCSICKKHKIVSEPQFFMLSSLQSEEFIEMCIGKG